MPKPGDLVVLAPHGLAVVESVAPSEGGEELSLHFETSGMRARLDATHPGLRPPVDAAAAEVLLNAAATAAAPEGPTEDLFPAWRQVMAEGDPHELARLYGGLVRLGSSRLSERRWLFMVSDALLPELAHALGSSVGELEAHLAERVKTTPPRLDAVTRPPLVAPQDPRATAADGLLLGRFEVRSHLRVGDAACLARADTVPDGGIVPFTQLRVRAGTWEAHLVLGRAQSGSFVGSGVARLVLVHEEAAPVPVDLEAPPRARIWIDCGRVGAVADDRTSEEAVRRQLLFASADPGACWDFGALCRSGLGDGTYALRTSGRPADRLELDFG